ncbi:beta-ketoacyl synthase N-terminal-like domain-containing protein, partial [Rhizobium leguminosarum]|uniref:beta-ketoacyl synthase N-terminal-like domain-containing protein n=1 Tax=Rhizobium leguminosarum TaxID=384 RepID=UPI003F97184B
MDRIVVTGMGLVSPLGTGVASAWKRLIDYGSGLRVLAANIIGDLSATVGGIVPGLA